MQVGPQTNVIVERLHRNLIDQHFWAEGWRSWFETINMMQVAFDSHPKSYNRSRPHQGRGM